MYLYTDFDQQLINERVAQFRDQTERYLAGKLTEDEYRPLRLQNGLYVQRYAPMLRIAVPYGLMNSKQLRKVAELAKEYDRGYAHVSTRQNIQFNWPALENVPEMLAELATVQMHAIQTSGNCIRNTTTDQYAGVVAGEIADPRPTCELIRQWSTFHPEFAFLPRKFKIAVSALEEIDRAATSFHDIGVYIVKNEAGEVGYKIKVGGGLGRTPVIGSFIREFLPREDLIAYLEAVLRVYNLHGRCDNKYKARIKILVKALTPEVFAEKVEAEFAHTIQTLKIQPEILKKLDEEFTPFDYQDLTAIAFSRGPGSFSGVRINAAVTQALAWSNDIPVIPVSTLQALAQAAYRIEGLTEVTAILDARMSEVYVASFKLNDQNVMQAVDEEQLLNYTDAQLAVKYQLVGSGSELVDPQQTQYKNLSATAQDIAFIARELAKQEQWLSAELALPVYLRDNAWKKIAEQGKQS